LANVKTAISLPNSLLAAVEAIAREKRLSRSRLMALALAEYVERCRSQQTLDQLNAVHTDSADYGDQQVIHRYRQVHRQLVDGQW